MTEVVSTCIRTRWKTFVRFAFAALVVATAYFYNLGSPPLWGDEAGTGIFARNVLKFGYPTAYDGRNLSIYDGGAELNADLVVVKIPWIQFYLGALSLRLFGDDAHGLRTAFALLGALSLFPMAAVLRNRVPSPLFVTTLVLLMPQVILFHRNARYYSTLTLLFSLLAWVVCRENMSRRSRTISCSVLMALMFHTHPLAALTCSVGLLLPALWRRQGFSTYFLASSVGLGTWLLWYACVGPTLVAPTLLVEFQGKLPSEWVSIAIQDFADSLFDIDAVQGMPLLAWVTGLFILHKVLPDRFSQFSKDPLVAFVGITLAAQLALISVLFGTETAGNYALLRYMPHLIVFAPILLFILIGKLARGRSVFSALCVAIAFTNIPTLSYWRGSSELPIPLSWWPATYLEILLPQREAWDAAMHFIDQDPTVVPGGFETLAVVPQWLQEVAIFYLGHKFIVAPSLEAGTVGISTVLHRIGEKAFERFQAAPKWVIYESPQAPSTVAGYERFILPTHRSRPDDGTRPELTRHTFYRAEALSNLSLYRRIQ